MWRLLICHCYANGGEVLADREAIWRGILEHRYEMLEANLLGGREHWGI